jgi:hypothetical protein
VRSLLEECKGLLKFLEPPAPKPPVAAAKRLQPKAPPVVVQEASAPALDDLSSLYQTIREVERWRKKIIGPQLASVEQSIKELSGKLKLKSDEATNLRETLEKLDGVEASARTLIALLRGTKK